MLLTAMKSLAVLTMVPYRTPASVLVGAEVECATGAKDDTELNVGDAEVRQLDGVPPVAVKSFHV